MSVSVRLMWTALSSARVYTFRVQVLKSQRRTLTTLVFTNQMSLKVSTSSPCWWTSKHRYFQSFRAAQDPPWSILHLEHFVFEAQLFTGSQGKSWTIHGSPFHPLQQRLKPLEGKAALAPKTIKNIQKPISDFEAPCIPCGHRSTVHACRSCPKRAPCWVLYSVKRYKSKNTMNPQQKQSFLGGGRGKKKNCPTNPNPLPYEPYAFIDKTCSTSAHPSVSVRIAWKTHGQ